MLGALASAVALAASVLALGPEAAAADWSPSTLVPVTRTGDASNTYQSVGLAANGDAAIAWSDGRVRIPPRTGGTGAPTATISPQASTGRPKIAMNERGDIALVYMQGGKVCLGYRPAGGV